MSRVAIRAEGLGKEYALGDARASYRTLRESLVELVRRPLRLGRRSQSRAAEAETIWALQDVSFEIREGSAVGIIGRNGAGKSTLLKVLSRITTPTRGYAEIHGRVGSLLEVGTGFHSELTGRENTYLNGAILGMKRVEINRKFDEIVGFAELEKFIDTPVKHYSSGMYMRLAFAVAAHLDTEILLVDEVLAVGDATFQKRCLGKMEEVASAGRTVMFVSHNLIAVAALCQRAIWIDAGSVAADGDADEVTGRYLTRVSEGSFEYVNAEAGLTIERVVLRDGRGRACTHFQPGDDLVVEIGFRASRAVRQPYVMIQVSSTLGPCFSANMMLDGHRPAELEGSGRLQCVFRSIPLLPQAYTVRMAIRKSDGKEHILGLQDVASFTVGGSLADRGLRGEFQALAVRATAVMIPYEWRLPDGSTAAVTLAAPPVPGEEDGGVVPSLPGSESMNAQVADDLALLDLMMQDAAQASPLYRPAGVWSAYGEQFLPELRSQGLKDFRRRRDSVMLRFGASDLEPRFARVELTRSRLFQNRFTPWIPGWSALRNRLNTLLNQPGYSPIEPDLFGCTVEDLKRTAFEVARLLGEKAGARPIADLEVSLIGSPEDAFEVGGKFYTMRTLYYYLRYLYCFRFIDFGRIRILAELGSGSGKQVEVLRKLHPEICFLVFDIPPQLYVAERYLDAVFPGSVVSYRKTREGAALEVRPGAILMLGSWKVPRIEEHVIDLFWSAVSFQEMEADVTANYLGYVSRCARAVYLQQLMSGPAPKKHGVLRKTTLEDYRAGLKEFEMVDLTPCQVPLGRLDGYYDSFWRRLGPGGAA